MIGISPLFPGTQTPSQDNAACFECHSTETLCAERLKINNENYLSSVHGRLACTDCHHLTLSEKKEVPPHVKKAPPVNCTETCHRTPQEHKPDQGPLDYPDSVHGRSYLERGNQEVAKCWNCHTKHNIRKASDPTSTVNRRHIPLTCSVCHENMSVVVKYNIHCEQPYREYMQSIHGKALFKDGLLNLAAVCTDCHGVHNIRGAGDPHLMTKKPETCGKCHVLILDEYRGSIHGRAAAEGVVEAPLCVDCHGEHNISAPVDEAAPTSKKHIQHTCSVCHARPEIMKKYDVPEDRIESFIQSLHGIAIGLGSEAAATCTSCHGVHDIRPAEDPASKVHPAKMAQTCGQTDCHPGMPEKIAKSKIHIDTNQKKSGLPYYLQKIFLWIVFLLVVITALWFSIGFTKKSKLLKRRPRR